MSNLRFDQNTQRYTWLFHKVGLQQSLLNAIHTNQYDALVAYDGPILFVRGSESQHFTELEYHDLLVKYPKVKGCVIDGAGHWIHADQHKLLVGALLAWLPNP